MVWVVSTPRRAEAFLLWPKGGVTVLLKEHLFSHPFQQGSVCVSSSQPPAAHLQSPATMSRTTSQPDMTGYVDEKKVALGDDDMTVGSVDKVDALVAEDHSHEIKLRTMSWQKAAWLLCGEQVCLAIMAQSWSLSYVCHGRNTPQLTTNTTPSASLDGFLVSLLWSFQEFSSMLHPSQCIVTSWRTRKLEISATLHTTPVEKARSRMSSLVSCCWPTISCLSGFTSLLDLKYSTLYRLTRNAPWSFP